MSAKKSSEKRKRQTFIVDIIAHQKCTWQGQLHWIQEDKKVSFRSVMEMLRLMDLAITGEDEPQEE